MKEDAIGVSEFLFDYRFENVLCNYSEGNKKLKKVNEKLECYN